jgi:hypothetical protein
VKLLQAPSSAAAALARTVERVYPTEIERLIATSASDLGVKATLQQVVDRNAAFLTKLRGDGLRLADIAAILSELGIGADGKAVSAKSLQSALARADTASSHSSSLERRPNPWSSLATIESGAPKPPAADCSALPSAAAYRSVLPVTAVNRGLPPRTATSDSALHQAAADGSALQATAFAASSPRERSQEPALSTPSKPRDQTALTLTDRAEAARRNRGVTMPSAPRPQNPLLALDLRVTRAAKFLESNGE